MKNNISNDELIREHKRTELILEGERAVLEMIATGNPLNEILEAITLHCEALAKNSICSVLLINREGTHVIHGAAPNLPEAYNRGVDGEPIGPVAGSCGTAAFRKERVIVSDIANDPLWVTYRDFALSFGLKACWSTPIIGSANKVLGTFAIYYKEPRNPSPEDIALVDRVSNLAKITLKRYYKEVQLRESKEKYRATLERITDGFVAFDNNLYFTFVNKSSEAILGRDPQSLIGKYAFDEFPETLGSPVHKAAEKAIVEQRYIHTEDYYKEYDRWFESHIYPSPEGVSIYFRDITDKKKAELKINEANEQFELIARATNDVIWDWNLLTGEVKWNEKYNSLFGYPILPFYDVTSWTNGIHPDDRDKIVEGIHKVIDSNQKLWHDDYRCLKQDGSIVYIHDRGFVLHDTSGKPYRMIGSMLDITARKKSENEILKERNLSDSIINSLPGIFYHIDEQGNYIRWNRQKEIIYGYSFNEMSQMNALDFFDESDRELIRSKIGEVLEKGSTNVEAQLVTKDQQKIWYYFTAISAEHDGKKTVIGTGIDISDRKKAEDKLRLAKERLEIAEQQAGLGSWEVDVQNHTRSWSKQIFRHYGMQPADQVPAYEEYLDRIHPEDQENFSKNSTAIQKGIEPVMQVYRTNPELLPLKYLLPTLEVTKDDQGNPLKYFGTLLDITERINAEYQIKESEEKYRTLVEQASDGIIIANESLQIVDANNRICTILGYAAEELLTLKVFDVTILNSEEAPVRFEELKAGKSILQERNFKRRDGTIIPVEVSSIIMKNGNYLALVRDITERKISAQNLKESEERHRSIVEQSLTGIYIIQGDYFIYTNPQFAKIFGYTYEEILTSIKADEVVYEPDRVLVRNTVLQRLEGKKVNANYTFRGVKKDGTVIHVEVFSAKAMHARQPVTVGTLLDITDRKKAEESLYKSEKYLSTLTNSIADAVFTVKMPERLIEYSNQSITEIFGYTIDELIGNTTRLFYPDEAGFLAFGQKIQNALGDGLSKFRTEHKLIRKNGDLFWAEIAVSFIRSGGEPTHVISVIHDITKRKKAEEEIRISSQKLSSHLNNSPLAVIEWDKNMVVKSWSIQAERIFEWTEAEVINKHFNDFNLVFAEDANVVDILAKDLMTGAVAQNMVINRNNTKSGKIVYCQWFNSVLLDENGNTLSILSLVEDRTESKKTEERIIHLNQELEVRVKMRTAELEKANAELEEINDLFLGRESRIIELKEELESLKQKVQLHD